MPYGARLDDLGWDGGWEAAFSPSAAEGLIPGRVVRDDRGSYLVATERAELRSETTGKLRYTASSAAQLPATGDWAALRTSGELGIIHRVLDRRTSFTRGVSSGRATEEQVLAANVDEAWIVTSLNAELNLRRIERYLALAWEGGILPVVLLTKADLADDPDGSLAEVAAIAPGADAAVVSAITGEGMEQLRPRLVPGKTVALIGSSGVGKSTLLNALAGKAIAATGEIRDDDKGRHTTTARQLTLLPGGGGVLDTPGLREVGLWIESASPLAHAFTDVEQHAGECRFSDCTHSTEPGCSVLAALTDGSLSRDRLEAYRKLKREAEFLERKRDKRAQAEERKRLRVMHRSARAHYAATKGGTKR